MRARIEELHDLMEYEAEQRYRLQPGGHTGRTSTGDKRLAYKVGYLDGIHNYRTLTAEQWDEEERRLVQALHHANLVSACEEFDMEEAASTAMFALGFRRANEPHT